jgi:hypothetical protein
MPLSLRSLGSSLMADTKRFKSRRNGGCFYRFGKIRNSKLLGSFMRTDLRLRFSGLSDER